LAAAGVFSSSSGSELVIDPTESVAVFVAPDVAAQLLSPQGDVTIDIEAGTFGSTSQLTYEPFSIGDMPALAREYRSTGTIFDLTSSEPLLKAITITARFSSVDETLADSNPANVIIQHYHDGAWELLDTMVDFAAATAKTQVDQLSVFALTIREPEQVPTPETPPTSILSPPKEPTATATPSTSTPIPVPAATAIPVPTPKQVVQYKLDIEVEPASLGTVTVRPSSDDGRYPEGRDVVVTAQCSADFGAWEGSVPQGASRNSRTITVTMDRDRLLVATCLEPEPTATFTPTPSPTPTPTPRPTATLRPTATPVPVPGFKLFVNGLQVLGGQIVIRVPGGTVTLHQLAQSNGTYVPGSTVTMEAKPDITGSAISWQGATSQDGSKATVVMRGERFVSANIAFTSQTPTPVPSATAIPTPVPTAVPTSGPTATPQPPGDPTHTPTLTHTVTPTPTLTPTATVTPSNGKIVFAREPDGVNGWDIYVMDADGTNIERITSVIGHNLYPAWSNDSSKIAFESVRDGNSEIYIMNSNGSGQTRLTNQSQNDLHADWSPDGTKIAFSSERDGNREIYVMESDGSNQTRLTSQSAFDDYPTWSPDGSSIAFASQRDGNMEIYVMNSDGSDQTRITSDISKD